MDYSKLTEDELWEALRESEERIVRLYEEKEAIEKKMDELKRKLFLEQVIK